MLDDPFFIHQRRHSSPEVISVPIHFFSSAQPPTPSPSQKESAALKIQNLFRGFLVRKSVNKISSIRNEVCKVESSINSTEIGELIRLDAKERLRVNETLMSLLFVLDSIRGVDFGVREFRRAVIKEAIVLQEKVDLFEVTSEQVIELESSSCPDHVIDVDLRVDSGVHDSRIPVIEKVIALKEKADSTVPDIDINKSDEIVSEIACESEITSEQVVKLESSSSRDQVIDVDLSVDSGVRDFRKYVIEKAITLQEKVDSIVSDKNKSDEIVSEIACENEITSEQVLELESSSFRDLTTEADNSMNLAADTDSVMNADCVTVTVIDSTMEIEKEIDVHCDYAVENTETFVKGTDDKNRNIRFLEKVDSIAPDKTQSAATVSVIACESEITSEHVLESSSCQVQFNESDNSVNLAAGTDSVMNADCVSVTVVDSTMEVEKEIDVNCDYAVENTEIRFLEKVDSIVPDKNQSDATGSVIVCESEITSQLVLELEPFSSRDLVIDADNPMNLAADTDSVMNADCVTVTVIDSTMEVEKEIDLNCDDAVENTETSGKATDDKKRDIRFLEKLIDDNEKMMKVMTQMFETNEMQTQMMNSLRKRVERLEKTIVCDKHRKKKKMNHSA